MIVALLAVIVLSLTSRINVGILAVAAGLAVGAEGHHVNFALDARVHINIGLAPRVVGDAALDVRPVPAGQTRWRGVQGIQAFICGGETPHVELENFERFFEVGNLHAGRFGFGAAQLAQHARTDQAGEHGQDGQHDQQFNEGEGQRRARFRCLRVSLRAKSVS